MKSKPILPAIKVSPADVAALRRASAAAAGAGENYLAFLARFPAATTDELRKRKGPRGEPFRL
jgi:hypothetical protein